MKVAIVHDSLLEYGGAEKILQVICSLYPDSHIFTAFADPLFRKTYLPHIPKDHFHTSFLQQFPINHHTSFVQAIAPLVWRSFDLSAFNLVISSSTHIMSSFVNVPRGTHVASLQYAPKNIYGVDPMTPFQKIIPFHFWTRPLFRNALLRSGHVVVNSHYTKSILEHYVKVPATVIYPPVTIPKTLMKPKTKKFYLCISRLVPYKGLELPILAATRLALPLKIFGVSYDADYEQYLRSLAGPTVEILPFRTNFDYYYEHAIAFIFPTKAEDFGIAPLEATARGIPVISYYGGGAKETMVEGLTGTFFHEHTVESLILAIERAKNMKFNRHAMYRYAKRFSESRYRNELSRYIKKAVQSDRKQI